MFSKHSYCCTLTLIFLIIANSMSIYSFQKRICYLRPEINFPVDDVIRLNLCTHIIVSFISIDSGSNLSYDQFTANFIELCRNAIDNFPQSNVKLMFSIGGGGNGGWPLASSTVERRQRFGNSILNTIHRYRLDGVDIDWEFPSWPRKISHFHEREDFINMLKEIREQFDKFQKVNGKSLVLSAAVAGQLAIIHVSYKPKQIAKYVDFINLMTYDYYIHKWYWPFIGHNSALFPKSIDIGLARTFNIEWSANYWNSLGVGKDQIMIGIPTYGKGYSLLLKQWKHPGISVATYGKEDWSYSKVCDFINKNGTKMEFDQEALVPYAYNEYEWLSFENPISAWHKALWAKQNRFGGTMLFSLNADDYRFRCSNAIFPIHSAVRDAHFLN